MAHEKLKIHIETTNTAFKRWLDVKLKQQVEVEYKLNDEKTSDDEDLYIVFPELNTREFTKLKEYVEKLELQLKSKDKIVVLLPNFGEEKIAHSRHIAMEKYLAEKELRYIQLNETYDKATSAD
jgi:hypothetical protein